MKAAEMCAETINSGKLVHLFGSGHSVLPIQDMFPRYGGVVGWHPLMDPRLMWNNARKAISSTSCKAITFRPAKS